MMPNKEKNFVSVVVYVHNNESYIAEFLNQVNQVLNERFEKYEIICVDDASDDHSIQIIKESAKNIKDAVVSIIHMSYYQGAERSMNAGTDLAIGDFVFEFDHVYIDYELTMIIKIYERSLEGFDIVNAAPRKMKRYSSRLFYGLFNCFSHQKYKLRTESFRVLSRRVINRVHSITKTIPYRKAVYANCGLKIDTIVYENRDSSKPQMDGNMLEIRQGIAVDALILFTDVAYKVSSSMTMFMVLVSILMGIYTMVIFFGNQPVAGWTTTMLFLALGFFGVFGIFAVVIKYLAILMDLTFKKKSYMTESIEKLTK